MSKLFKSVLIAAYLVCASLAYGHAYVNGEKTIAGFDGKHRDMDQMARGMVALTGAVLWPLYASIVFWENQND